MLNIDRSTSRKFFGIFKYGHNWNCHPEPHCHPERSEGSPELE